jgi:hypothetical protein
VDFRTQQVIGELTRNIARLEERLNRAERAAGTPQLPNSSLTNGAIKMVDVDGTDRGSIGWQDDGTVAIVPANGPPPPKPSTPGVAAAQLSLAVAWDGLFAEGDDGDPATQPKDFDHVQVHLSAISGYTPDASTLQGSLFKPGSVVITPLSDESTYYAVLVPVNTSGIPGEASDPTPGTPDPVVSGEVLDGSITTLKLADDAVTNAKIADTAVDANKLADGSVSAQKILDDAITAAKIDDGAVTAAALGPDAVTAGKLADGSIDASTLFAGGVVDTSAIGSGAVTTGKIAASTIVAGNISAGAIGATELAANAVTAGKIAANAVTAGKINAGAVTATEIATDTITASQIAAGAIGAAELAANSVIAGKIAAGVVDATALAAQSVTTAKLAALAVTANELAANAVTAGKIDAGAVTAGTIAAGAVTAAKLEATMVVATVLQSTGYVAGSSGWKVDGAGTAEFNSASFRGEVLIGPSGGPQTHIYSASGSGRIESLSNDAIENDPSRIISGTFGAGTTKQIQTNYYGARARSTGDRPVIAQISETASGGAPPYTQIGVITSGGSFSAAVTAYKFGAVLSSNDADTFLMTQQPTSTGDLAWHIFGNAAGSNGSWARPLPVPMVCPPSESVAFDLYFRGINTASTTSTIALSVQVKVGSTVIWQPANSDTDSCACYAMPGQTAKPTAAARVFRTVIIGADKLGGYGGQTLSITPMYRSSSGVGGSDWVFSAASFTMRALPEQHLSNVFS